jgi:hypothetical protein
MLYSIKSSVHLLRCTLNSDPQNRNSAKTKHGRWTEDLILYNMFCFSWVSVLGSLLSVHLSRWAEDLILYNSAKNKTCYTVSNLLPIYWDVHLTVILKTETHLKTKHVIQYQIFCPSSRWTEDLILYNMFCF